MISPSSGPAAGGTRITITGSHLTGATSVKVGTAAASNVTVVSDSSATATTPAGSGVAPVSVTTPGGTSQPNPPADQFTYAAAAPKPSSSPTTSSPTPASTPKAATSPRIATATPGSVSGTVTSGGVGVANICVTAYQGSPVGGINSAADGSYQITGLAPGSYTIDFNPCGANFIDQWYQNQPNQGTANPVNVVSGADTGAINASMQASGSITGTVTSGGAPVANICVSAHQGSSQPGGSSTAADGTYQISGLAPGSYTVDFSPCGANFIDQWYQDQPSQGSANPVNVSAGATTSGVNASIRAGGTISGVVTSGGVAVASICVAAYQGSTFAGGTSSAADGSYQLTALAPGSYTVDFNPCGANFMDQWYQNQPSQGSANPVNVSSGATTSGVNASLQAGGSISGTVTNGGVPVANACVSTHQGFNQAAGASTAADGTYLISGLAPGTYTVDFSPCGANFIDQWYQNQPDPASANPVNVSSGGTTSGVNASVHSGGTISGTVTNGGVALAGICVSAHQGFNQFGSAPSSAADGTYQITGLSAGTYTVDFNPCGANFSDQWYQDKATQAAANPVNVSSGANTGGVNASMHAGGSVSGHVSSGSTGNPLQGACVALYQGSNFAGNTATDASGNYTITGLPSGSYKVDFNACSAGNYLDQWYQNQPDQASANSIGVVAGTTTGGVNAALAPGGAISGTVTAAAGGAPISGICVSAQPTGGGQGSGVSSDASGHYTLGSLRAGTYQVKFFSCQGGNYAQQYYFGQTDPSSANLVTVTLGHTDTGIDAHMQVGAIIRGTVVDGSNGTPLANICVNAYNQGDQFNSLANATTAADGTYSLSGLPSGAFGVSFTACSGQNFVQQWYQGQSTAAAANPVTASTGATTSGVNASMVPGGQISGHVSGGGASLASVCVSAYQAGAFNGNSQYGSTDSSGNYTISGLPAGSYDVDFQACSAGNFLGQWYQNQPDQSHANPVNVTLAHLTGGVNANLAAGGTVTGHVTDTSGTALSSICVDLTSVSGAFVEGPNPVSTDASGNYSITRVNTGDYTVQFYNCGNAGNFAPQWYFGQATAAAANTIHVTAGFTSGGVNARMSPGGRLAGTVYDNLGNPVQGICVSDSGFVPGGANSVSTLADGTYQITNLPTGDYSVSFTDCRATPSLLPQWYQDQPTSPGNLVHVLAGTSAAGVDAHMHLGGSISGNVRDSGGVLAGICVTGNSATGYSGSNQTATTDALGNYTLRALQSGTYIVTFADCGAGPHVRQSYQNRSDGTADPVGVFAGATTTGIDANLAKGGTINGHVQDASANALQGICVTAYLGTTRVASASTNAAGDYTIDGLNTASFDVQFTQCSASGNLAPQWYNGHSTQSSADHVAVNYGFATNGVNAVMHPGSTIKGHVGDTHGASLAQVCVSASGVNGGSGSATTDSAGNYQMTQLIADTYSVDFVGSCFGQSNYVSQWYLGQPNQASATPISVGSGATVTGVNASLADAGTVTGTVRGAGSAPLANICVNITDTNNQAFFFGRTDAAGNYTATGLPTGTYTASFYNCGNPGNYLQQWYNGQSTQATANTFAVHAGSNTAGVNATLQPGAAIAGHVQDGTAAPLANISVIAVSTTAGGPSGSGYTDSTGNYSIGTLPTGSYKVSFIDYSGSFVTQWYNGQATQAAANTVVANAGSTTNGVNATMHGGATITGAVHDAAGHPLQQVCVSAFAGNNPAVVASGSTDVTGAYSMGGMPTGSYKVQFSPCSSGSPYAPAWYLGQSTQSSGNPVAVSSGSATSGVNATLSVGARISGTVTTAGGQPAGSICVQAVSSDATPNYGFAFTDAYGKFVIQGLPTGSYRIQYTDCGGQGLATRWYNGQVTPASANTIAVIAGSTAAGANTVLPATTATPANVYGLAPSTGTTAGGTSVVITGQGFTGTTAVYFGTASAGFVVNSDTQITATAPPGPSGYVDVVVNGAAGSSSISLGGGGKGGFGGGGGQYTYQ